MAVKANRVIRVFIIVIIALATSLFFYLLVNNFQFSRGRTVRVHFSSVGDLNTGAWVRKAGIKVGSATKLEPAEDEKTIIVTLRFQPGQIVRTADQFALVAKGILGDMYIEQKPGPKDSPLVEEGHLYEGEPSFNLTDLLGGDTMSMVTDLAGSLKGIVDMLKANQDTLDATLKDIAKTAKNARIITDRAVVMTDSVPDLTKQITSSLDSLQSTVADVATTAKKLVSKMDGDLTSSSTDLAASMKSLRKSTEEIQTAVTQLTAQNSVISTLSTPETAKNLEATVRNLQQVSQGLLEATKDTQKVIQGVSEIFQAK
jgi:phospholipid/cholesterol/gamma-HCH transport system substrate-binding protein